jgi:hypothetical protein
MHTQVVTVALRRAGRVNLTALIFNSYVAPKQAGRFLIAVVRSYDVTRGNFIISLNKIIT